MKKILCFGDSNTFGYIPETGKRYDSESRWTGVLQNLCKDKYTIIERGCNNRTALADNPVGDGQTGYKILPRYLAQEKNIDIVILAIGLNDVQFRYNVNILFIEKAAKKMIHIVREYFPSAKIILTSPARIGQSVLNSFFRELFDETSIEKSLSFSKIYEKLAKEENCVLVDWDKFVTTSEIDGLHFSKAEHLKIAQKYYEIINSLETKI